MKRVLIAHGNLLLTSGVESLLAREENLAVLGIANASRKSLVREIKRFHPDIVILDESLMLVELPQIVDLLEDYPGLPVMVLDMRRNLVHIYQKSEISVKGSSDLISIIMQGYHEYLGCK